MPTKQSSQEILNGEFLIIRAKILEVAAALDRIDRVGSAASDPRLARLREAIKLLLASEGDRAEQVQLHFSREFDKDWRANLGVK
jgi:hypothetical protein